MLHQNLSGISRTEKAYEQHRQEDPHRLPHHYRNLLTCRAVGYLAKPMTPLEVPDQQLTAHLVSIINQLHKLIELQNEIINELRAENQRLSSIARY